MLKIKKNKRLTLPPVNKAIEGFNVAQCDTSAPLPFLKWAGGKRWFTERYADFFPSKFSTYIEPFLGSGAVYFSLKPEKALLGDSNGDLISTYQALRLDWKRVRVLLAEHHVRHSRDHYYKIRDSEPENKFKRAARFIYLNRTCWNGLYRVNLRGEFNVPMGTKCNVLLQSDNFAEAAKILRRAKLKTADFESLIDQAKENDFVFADPPYTVQHATNGFIKYNERLFAWEDQERLRDALVRARNRGVRVVLTNAYHASIKKLYKDVFTLSTVKRPSVIAASREARTICKEYVITG